MIGQQRSYNNFQQRGFKNIHGNYNQVRDNKPQQKIKFVGPHYKVGRSLDQTHQSRHHQL